MKKFEQYVAVPNRKVSASTLELEELVKEASNCPDVKDVTLRKSNVTLVATPDAVDDLRKKLRGKVIIDPDQPVHPLN
ncbi:hypothetical protein ACJJI5_13420 [Microbulbifer sp. EKSA008]|uniref:hypothetical protein n=1 Tax=unclassified Microbulbifer TaxID=2619833 RepID=UPI0024AE0CD9|nr:hypothetical protein [Microbulbifer sp. VAAF005]WHI47055.1 hypothetical protein P0078_01395 [Microbulbifer sp. VAAF005]WNZ54351.1 hypothetical protein QT397_15785 [Microbulbifer sp. MKSA007]